MMPGTSFLALVALVLQTASGIDEFRLGHYQRAQQTLEQAIEKDPHDASARAFLAMARAAQHACTDAGQEFISNTDATLARQAGLAAVECNYASNHAGEAFALITALENRFPSDPDVLYESARLHRKAWDRAVAEMFKQAPGSFRVNQLSAEVFETQGKYGEAVQQYRKAIAKAPEALNLHYRLGRTLLLDSPAAENLEAARVAFAAELKLNPDDAVAEYQVGQILAAQANPQEARAHFERAVHLRPDFAEALIAVGKSRAQEKDFVHAAECFQKAVALQPDSEAAHYNLMLAYRNLNRDADARAQKRELDRLQKPPEGEFTEFLKKLGEKAPAQ